MLPFPVPLGVLIRLKLDERDVHESHHLPVAFIGPTGLPNVPPVELVAGPPADIPQLEGEERFANIALQIGAVLVRAGLYHLELHIDGRLARSLPLAVVVTGGQVHSASAREWPQDGQSAQAGRPTRAAAPSKAKRRAAPRSKAKRHPPKKGQRRK